MNFFHRQAPALPRIKALPKRRARIITVLDVGSDKLTCLIARLTPKPDSDVVPGRTHTINVLGVGLQRSLGIKSGVVVDVEAAQRAVRACVEGAERMAGLSVESLLVSVSAGQLRSVLGSASADIEGEVCATDIADVLANAARVPLGDRRIALHSLATDFSIDGERGLENVIGMTGSTLSAEMHVLTADETPLRNLEIVVNRARLAVEAFVAAPYASALATLVEDEAQMGSACIDLGGGSTSIAIFQNGKFVYADQIAIGGQHITMDLARGLSIRPADAERLKVVHGSALSALMNSDDTVNVMPLGEEAAETESPIARSLVARIVRPRVEEIFELVRERLAASGLGHVIGKRVVLTGGASQLAGIGEVAAQVLQRNVRLGRPVGVAGLGTAQKGPAFATSVGLLIYPQVATRENVGDTALPAFMVDRSTRTGRIGSWLRRSL